MNQLHTNMPDPSLTLAYVPLTDNNTCLYIWEPIRAFKWPLTVEILSAWNLTNTTAKHLGQHTVRQKTLTQQAAQAGVVA